MTDPNKDLAKQLEAMSATIATLREELRAVSGKVREIRTLVGPFGLTMPDGTVLVQTLFGTKYYIDPQDLIIAPNLIIYRQWEADLSALMSNAATPDMVFVDVGANFGYFTCLMGSLIKKGGRGRVISVEPNPAMIKLLRKNVTINWSMCPIEIFECAVANSNGTAEFRVPVNRASNASLVRQAAPAATVSGKEETITVPLKRIDDLVIPGTRVDLMKIDVEGHEWAALMGAQRVIHDSPKLAIIMEWSQAQMREAGYDCAAMLKLFSDLKLVAHRVPEDRRLAGVTGPGMSEEELSKLPYENLVLKRASV